MSINEKSNKAMSRIEAIAMLRRFSPGYILTQSGPSPDSTGRRCEQWELDYINSLLSKENIKKEKDV